MRSDKRKGEKRREEMKKHALYILPPESKDQDKIFTSDKPDHVSFLYLLKTIHSLANDFRNKILFHKQQNANCFYYMPVIIILTCFVEKIHETCK